jgi:hypothetical protein
MSGVDGKALDRILNRQKVFLLEDPPGHTNQPEDVSLQSGSD